MKVSKLAKIRNLYNQIPLLIQDTMLQSAKTQENKTRIKCLDFYSECFDRHDMTDKVLKLRLVFNLFQIWCCIIQRTHILCIIIKLANFCGEYA